MRGGHRPRRSVTLLQVGADWLDSDHALSLAPNTRRTYTGVIELHIMKWIGSAKVEYIDAPFVKGWQRDLASAGVPPDARARALKYLKMLLNFAVEEGHLQGNPAMVVRPPKIPASEPVKVLSPRQIESVIAKMDREQDRIYIALMAYAGLRPGEVHRLTWDRIQERSIIVRAEKSNRVDTVRVWDFLIEDLERWRQAGSQTVIPNGPWGKTRYDNWRTRVFNPAVKAAGFPLITPMTFRHSYASMLLRAGWQPINVAAAMRHGLDMTQTVYGHVIADIDPLDPLILPDAILDARAKLTTNGHAALV